MTQDVSAFGLRVQLVASNTFPAGITLAQFADDADPLDFPSIQIADKAMGVNGDLIVWSKANPITVTLNVIAGSEDDNNLAILFEANRVGRGKFSARDIITLTSLLPNGKSTTVSGGRITDGMPGQSIASAGRMKTKAYIFAFEGLSRT